LSAGWQWSALAEIGDTANLLSVGRTQTFACPLAVEPARRLVESAVRASCASRAADWQSQPQGFAARVALAGEDAANVLRQLRLHVSAVANGQHATTVEVRIAAPAWAGWLFGSARLAHLLKQVAASVHTHLAQLQRVAVDTQTAALAAEKRSESTLALLRAQVEPHFVFNTLAHIKACMNAAERDIAPLAAPSATASMLLSTSYVVTARPWAKRVRAWSKNSPWCGATLN
jgi:hypothetical protein